MFPEPCDASNVVDDVQDQGSFNDTAEESFFEDTCNTQSCNFAFACKLLL